MGTQNFQLSYVNQHFSLRESRDLFTMRLASGLIENESEDLGEIYNICTMNPTPRLIENESEDLGEIYNMCTMSPAPRLIESEGEETAQNLPEELVEKIVALMPFPSIFKARLLSRSWVSKLSSHGPDDDEDTKRIRSLFQKQVRESSNNWEAFTAWIFRDISAMIFRDSLWVYCPGSHSWRRILSLSDMLHVGWGTVNVQTAGALVLLYPSFRLYVNTCLLITNVLALTKSWRILPPCQNKQYDKFFSIKLVSYPELQTYRVILLCSRYDKDLNASKCIAQLYDSESGEWKCKELVNSKGMLWKPLLALKNVQHSVYLNGLLYVVTIWTHLLSFNIEEGTWEDHRIRVLGQRDIELFPYTVHLVVWNDTLLEILTEGGSVEEPLFNYRVLKVDLKRNVVKELTRGPPPPLNVGLFRSQPISDGDCIFLGVEEVSGRVFTYNIKEDQWGCLPFPVSIPDQSVLAK